MPPAINNNVKIHYKITGEGKPLVLHHGGGSCIEDLFSLGYIDADHSYDAVKEDILEWWSKVKLGGMISGHDFDPDPKYKGYDKFEVNLAIREIFGSHFRLTGERYFKSWYVIKGGYQLCDASY